MSFFPAMGSNGAPPNPLAGSERPLPAGVKRGEKGRKGRKKGNKGKGWENPQELLVMALHTKGKRKE